MSERPSVSTANIIFNQRPRTKLIALRDNPNSYTIVRRGEVPANFLFSPPFVSPSRMVSSQPLQRTSRINIRDLRDIIFNRLHRSERDDRGNDDRGNDDRGNDDRGNDDRRDEIQGAQQLTDFINSTFGSNRPNITPLSSSVNLQESKITTVQEEKCSICLETFEIDDTIITLECGHINHSSCLRRWFEEHNTCTQCRFIPR